MNSKHLRELSRKLNPRLSEVLESISAKKGEEHAIAIERALKTTAAVAQLGAMVHGSDKKIADMLQQVCIDNITKLVSIIGIDPEDLHGAGKASMADIDDLFRMVKK